LKKADKTKAFLSYAICVKKKRRQEKEFPAAASNQTKTNETIRATLKTQSLRCAAKIKTLIYKV
jgi:hypothetical protein